MDFKSGDIVLVKINERGDLSLGIIVDGRLSGSYNDFCTVQILPDQYLYTYHYSLIIPNPTEVEKVYYGL